MNYKCSISLWEEWVNTKYQSEDLIVSGGLATQGLCYDEVHPLETTL